MDFDDEDEDEDEDCASRSSLEARFKNRVSV